MVERRMMRRFLGQAKVVQRASVGGKRVWLEVSKADKKCKRVTERSDWHSRVSDSVKLKERVWVKECDENW